MVALARFLLILATTLARLRGLAWGAAPPVRVRPRP